MTIDNILYTPLDCPPPPPCDIQQLYQWFQDNTDILWCLTEQSSNEGNLADKCEPNYPWDVKIPYRKFTDTDPGWVGGFDTKFPELAAYFYEAFGQSLQDVGIIVLLPVKSGHTGLGFWHRDPDKWGLRMYLEYESQQENTLLIRKNGAEDDVKQCVPVSSRQCFFLNNEHATHTTFTTVPDKTRIAALVIGRLDPQSQAEWKQKITGLVERSAAMYPNNAVLA